MKKVKCIDFRLKIKGEDIVNGDSTEQKFQFLDKPNVKQRLWSRHDNISYGKKNFYKDSDGNDYYKIVISSDCLTKAIFSEDVIAQNPRIIHDPLLFNSYIASPYGILHGYLLFDKENESATTKTFARTSPINLSAAEQTCNAVSTITTCSRSGEKITSEDSADNSFFKRETVGKIEYEATGQINLDGLQFIPVDYVLRQAALNEDEYEKYYKPFLQTRLKNFDSNLDFYTKNTSVSDFPEKGVLLTNENIVDLVKDYFTRLMKLDIRRKRAYATISELQYKLIYDVIDDRINTEDNWVTIQSRSDIESINFESEIFYSEVKNSDTLKVREVINAKAEDMRKMSSKKKAKKVSKTDNEETVIS